MKKFGDWCKTWTVPQVIGASVAMLCITAMCIVITIQDDWGKLVHWLSQPESMVLLGGIVTGLVTAYHRALVTPVALLLLVFLGSSSIGCASAIRTHAIAAHSSHEAVALAGGTIVSLERAALAACPHDDGTDRTTCLDHAEHTFTIAAASRDLLIPGVDAYRDLTFTACGIDPHATPIVIPDACPDPPPDVMQRIESAGAQVLADEAILTASVAALERAGSN